MYNKFSIVEFSSPNNNNKAINITPPPPPSSTSIILSPELSNVAATNTSTTAAVTTQPLSSTQSSAKSNIKIPKKRGRPRKNNALSLYSGEMVITSTESIIPSDHKRKFTDSSTQTSPTPSLSSLSSDESSTGSVILPKLETCGGACIILTHVDDVHAMHQENIITTSLRDDDLDINKNDSSCCERNKSKHVNIPSPSSQTSLSTQVLDQHTKKKTRMSISFEELLN